MPNIKTTKWGHNSNIKQTKQKLNSGKFWTLSRKHPMSKQVGL